MYGFILALACVALLSAGALVAGCQNQGGPSARDGAKLYDVKGTVVSLDAEKKLVTLDHEDIPGLMKAMKMEFSVESAKVLDAVTAGDAVTGTLKAEGGTYVVTSLKKR